MPRPRGRISSREVDQASDSNAGARATHEKSCKGLVLGCARAASAANTTASAAGHAEVAASAAAAAASCDAGEPGEPDDAEPASLAAAKKPKLRDTVFHALLRLFLVKFRLVTW